MVSRGLVFGGGGHTGFAWQWGVLTGLCEAGVDLAAADLVVGTSGGAMVAAHFTAGAPLRPMIEAMAEPPPRFDDRANEDSRALFTAELTRLIASSSDARQIRIGLGVLALSADAGTEERNREVVSWYLRSRDWPRRRLVVTAVDVHSGELAAFGRDSGVPMVDALAASNAIPGVWPPVTINGRQYMDGTVRSPINADVAAGQDRVLVLAPMPTIRGLPGAGLEEQLAPVRAAGKVMVISPDEESRAAMGRDMLSFDRREKTVHAGLAQAAAVLGEVRALWAG